MPTSKNSFMQFVGEITSTPPSTGAGVREYCHNLYNGCFLKVEVDDFRRFLGYVLKDGYNWMYELLDLGEILCFPCIPNT